MKLLKAVGVYISIIAFVFFLFKGCSKVGVLINGGGTDSNGLETMAFIGLIMFIVFLIVIMPIIGIYEMMDK